MRSVARKCQTNVKKVSTGVKNKIKYGQIEIMISEFRINLVNQMHTLLRIGQGSFDLSELISKTGVQSSGVDFFFAFYPKILIK